MTDRVFFGHVETAANLFWSSAPGEFLVGLDVYQDVSLYDFEGVGFLELV